MNSGEKDFHATCARKFFGVSPAPILDYTQADMDSLAAELIQTQTTLTGVQPKISLHLNEHKGGCRLTIVGLWGGFILKPQTKMFPFLPKEYQDAYWQMVCDRLARLNEKPVCNKSQRP